MRYCQLIDDETFIKEKNNLQVKVNQLKEKLRATETRAEKWLELTERTFNFTTYARRAFLTGGLELKKEILIALGESVIIRDEKLYIEPNKWLQPIGNGYPVLEKEYLRLEPVKMSINKAKTEALASVFARWLRIVDNVKTIIQRQNEYIYIPDLSPQV